MHTLNAGNSLSVANQPVTVQLHRTLNKVKGTVLSEVLAMNTETEILEFLKMQGVTKIEPMKRRVQGELIEMNDTLLDLQEQK